jgi:hypothetical protein
MRACYIQAALWSHITMGDKVPIPTPLGKKVALWMKFKNVYQIPTYKKMRMLKKVIFLLELHCCFLHKESSYSWCSKENLY